MLDAHIQLNMRRAHCVPSPSPLRTTATLAMCVLSVRLGGRKSLVAAKLPRTCAKKLYNQFLWEQIFDWAIQPNAVPID